MRLLVEVLGMSPGPVQLSLTFIAYNTIYTIFANECQVLVRNPIFKAHKLRTKEILFTNNPPVESLDCMIYEIVP